ncbi:MAG: aminopeptidase N [Alphaproteobacteria bacterium]|nr:aminopeptidase N [Alphaproteobacteria bacterium]
MPDTSLDTPPMATRLADYRVPEFLVHTVELTFDLAPEETRVAARMALGRNPAAGDGAAPLRLDGDEVELLSLALDGRVLGAAEYHVEAKTAQSTGALVIPDVPERFTLDIVTRIAPARNTALSGLYISGGNFCTQCEPEGFRRITYFLDRPDVMTRYTVTMRADKTRFPILLSNGNPSGAGDLVDGRHWARWVDPHPKPSYLFALVAGDLVGVHDSFTTRSGRIVKLAIWVRRGDEDKCAHAMESLKKSMAWDEEVFGLEYDLDVFNIVAVSDFNMGAMENKGLNVFNTRYVLAKPDTATDTDYQGIETVIAHEYFHNWTGNRVTCRDWFQLSLKEGLTVFRDQLFSADQGSEAVSRIGNIRTLRAAQFPEDAGPLAHPVQPQSYLRIDNFYTATVYNKGAEVIRMMHTLLGPERFRRGMDLYIGRNDNHAATIGDFLAAMREAGREAGRDVGVDLSQFELWYRQAGTPEITVEDVYDAAARRYDLTVSQLVPPTPGQPDKQPMPIPLAIGLLGPNGDEMPAQLEGEAAAGQTGTRVLLPAGERQTYRFVDVAAPPVPSLLRKFSAPVKLAGVPLDRLKFLAIHDTDPVARWDAGQRVATRVLLERVAAYDTGRAIPPLDPDLIAAMRQTLADADRDPAFAAEALLLPSENTLADEMPVVAIEAIHAAREFTRREVAHSLAEPLRETYRNFADLGPYHVDGRSIGGRALRNACLAYLAAGDTGEGAGLAKAQFDAGANMTDVLAALSVLVDLDVPERSAALAAFYARWTDDLLVIDKWFALQARSSVPGTIAVVRDLTSHPAFTRSNPNRVRALIGTFSQANPVHFHEASGAGYEFLADEVVGLDRSNPTTAARLVQPLGQWRRHDAGRQQKMRDALTRIRAVTGLSPNTFEMVSKSLGE